MKTFEREIEYAVWEFDATQKEPVEKTIQKTVSFNELSRNNKGQHKLHFKIISLFQSQGGDANAVNLDSDALYDITVKAINELAISMIHLLRRIRLIF